MSVVTSFFPGRIRLRGEIFKDKDIVDAAMKAASGRSWIESIEHNPRTGSVLIEYDTEKVDPEKLRPMIPYLMEIRSKAMFYNPKYKERIIEFIGTASRKLDQLI